MTTELMEFEKRHKFVVGICPALLARAVNKI